VPADVFQALHETLSAGCFPCGSGVFLTSGLLHTMWTATVGELRSFVGVAATVPALQQGEEQWRMQSSAVARLRRRQVYSRRG
jgi:hypothetical protein